MHLFLSPHLDDAVLSCGGTIHQLTAQGEAVTVLTIMAGDPPDSLPDTPIIADLHQRWEAGFNPAETRRREDQRAVNALGARAIHWPVGDCVYRTARRGGEIVALYPTEESLWGGVPLDDPSLQFLAGAELLPAETIYVPLGVGHHVDHQVVRDWGLTLNRPQRALVFYEEYPYTNARTEIDRALAYFAPRRLEPDLHDLTEADVAAKVAAIACYKSQISTFWADLNDMELATRRMLIEAGDGVPAERFWRMV